MDELKKTTINLDELDSFSFTPVSELVQSAEENASEDEAKEVIKPTDTDDSGTDSVPTSVAPRKETSERLEKLRNYYAELGHARDEMQQELERVLGGTVVEGEIEAKLYEFSHSWRSISNEINKMDNLDERRGQLDISDYHLGQNLSGMDYSGQDLSKKDFSAANLQDSNFQNAQLVGVDFTGADLSGADLSGADLTDAIFAGAKLKGTNFTGANMEGVILRDADIEDAILIDIRMDELAIEELQALVEYLAIYYPHKLNLRRINLSLLDLSKIDLRLVDLRGVDFTGIDFTGVNIMELDLSECIITPEQIAQALGRVPSPEELKKILAPKNKKKAKKFYIDFSDFFSNKGIKGWIDLTKYSISTDDLVKGFLKVKNAILKKPEEKDDVIFEKAKEFHQEREAEERRAYNEEQKKNIEARKQKIMEESQNKIETAEKYTPIKVNLGRDSGGM